MVNTLGSTLRITEIFHSVQGESLSMGIPTVFVRLTGCPLRCQYCDTTYAFKGGKITPIEQIINEVDSYQCKYVCVTGGEPLAQPNCLTLLEKLCNKGYTVSLETSGAFDISKIDKRVVVVMDLKTPDSLESEKNNLDNIRHLTEKDQIKFVLCSRKDYEWAQEMIVQHGLYDRATILFSPSWNQLNPTILAEWILKDNLKVRFQLQLHKILWNDAPGH